MRIKTQFITATLLFCIISVVIAASAIITNQRWEKVGQQETLARELAQGASELGYLSQDYLIYREDQQLNRWLVRFASFSAQAADLRTTEPEQRAVISKIEANQRRLREVFDSVTSAQRSSELSQGEVFDSAALQVSWSRMAVQILGLVSDASRLSQLLHQQMDQITETRTLLIYVMVALFGVFLLSSYMLTYRGILKSIATLQAGTKTIGAGNLEFKIKEKRNDEIGDLCRAFNRMTADLMTVTASKADLEREMSERKLAEEALRQSEQRWAVTLASIGDAVIATDTGGRITFLNKVAEELTGWSLSNAAGKSIKDVFCIVNEHTRATVEDPVSKVLQTGMIVGLANHTVLLRKGGGEIPIDDSGAPIRDEKGRILGVVLTFRDITERTLAEETLRQSKSLIKADLAAMTKLQELGSLYLKEEALEPVLVDIVDAAIAISGADFGLIQILDHKSSSLRIEAQRGFPKWWLEFWDSVSKGQGASGTALERGERVVVEDVERSPIFIGTPALGIHLKAGVRAVQSTPLVSRSGKPLGMFSTHHKVPHRPDDRELRYLDLLGRQAADFIEQAQAKQSLRQLNETLEQQVAERTELAEARARLLQSLAIELIEAEERERRRVAELLHDDLQQILAAAHMQLQSACENLRPEPMLANVEQLLEESIGKSRRLSHELSPAVLHHSGLVGALQWLARQMRDQFGLNVQLESDSTQQFEKVPMKVFLFRAIQELLFNVVKHAGVKSARVGLTGSDRSLTITVSDQGLGLDPEILNSPTATGGIGLLSLRERARYIGGSLVIESDPGRGSRFTLTVPLSLAKAEEIELPRPGQQPLAKEVLPASAVARGIRVLFADDHQVMRNGLIKLMDSHPDIHVVGEASNGREAVERAWQLKPDVVVMDVSMPEMDGIEATRRIKAEMPEVRVIGLSMHEDEQIARSMREAGAEAFVSKAAPTAELLKAIYGIGRPERVFQ